jgi:hypothetical protein
VKFYPIILVSLNVLQDYIEGEAFARNQDSFQDIRMLACRWNFPRRKVFNPGYGPETVRV